MAEEQDVDTLKRRSRRRLIGAIALVLLAVIVLPMVFDAEPKGGGTAVQIRIPGEGEGGFTPKGPAADAPADPARASARLPAGGTNSAQSVQTIAAADKAPGLAQEPDARLPPPASQSAAVASVPAAVKPAANAMPSTTPPALRKDTEPVARGPGFIVPVAAFASADKLQRLVAILRAAKVPYYTEPVATVKGRVTRVRAGPYETRESAEAARERLRGLGLKPGSAVARAG